MKEVSYQKAVLSENNLPIENVRDVILGKSRTLWERKLEHTDFLEFRLGTGNRKPNIEIKSYAIKAGAKALSTYFKENYSWNINGYVKDIQVKKGNEVLASTIFKRDLDTLLTVNNLPKDATTELMNSQALAKQDMAKFKGENLLELFNSPEWEKLSETCLGCGTCTFVCPTCQCYDIRDFNTGKGVKRFRCWDSCMYSDFTKMAAENPRKSQLERSRQRFMHKLVYYPTKNEGIYGCVGCGRCLNKCPISMNIVKVIKKLSNTKGDN